MVGLIDHCTESLAVLYSFRFPDVSRSSHLQSLCNLACQHGGGFSFFFSFSSFRVPPIVRSLAAQEKRDRRRPVWRRFLRRYTQQLDPGRVSLLYVLTHLCFFFPFLNA